MALISSSIDMIVMLFILFLYSETASAQLSKEYYAKTCPKALSTIRNAVSKSVMKEHRMGASLLRLHFHDCFVNGCDGSVLLDDTATAKGEKTAAPNAESLRGFEVIDRVKSEVETVCPGVVSCSDILAVAARDSVVTLGGPSWEVELGRRDSDTASFGAANTELPSPILDVADLITFFSLKGFTAKDMVALSGGHTTGKAKCVLFRNRIYNESDIDSSFATAIKSNCPSSSGDDELSSLDKTSPVIFDNGFFKNLVKQKGLLHSDQQLFSNASTDSLVTTYTQNATLFFQDFAAAMLKMGRLGPLTGTDGQIRADCRKPN